MPYIEVTHADVRAQGGALRSRGVACVPVPPIHAFWSYSQPSGLLGVGTLHEVLQTALCEVLAPNKLEVFRDTINIAGGADWEREIVRAVARSTLFFWVQSPRWLHRSVCRFEFEVFRDRVNAAALALGSAEVSTAFDDLLEALVVPIRLADVDHAKQWRGVPEWIRRDWERLQVAPELQLHKNAQHAVSASAWSITSATAICRRVDAVFARYGMSWEAWSGLLERDTLRFEHQWSEEFARRRLIQHHEERRTIVGTDGEPHIGASAELARSLTNGRMHLQRPELGLTLVPVPRTNGSAFWCASATVSNRYAAAWARRFGLNVPPELGSRGALVWSREAIAQLLPELREDGLDIPDAGLAEDLVHALGRGRKAMHQLGVTELPQNFWTTADGDTPAIFGSSAEHGELLVVSTLEEARHA